MNEVESQELIHIIRTLPGRGTSVLIIEHDMMVIRGVSDHAVVLDHGAVIASGTVDAVLSDTRVIDAYLGIPDA
jgi:branched-chain amino acid transport system permease protein